MADLEYSNRVKKQEKDLKTNCMNMTEVLKEQMKKYLKGIHETWSNNGRKSINCLNKAKNELTVEWRVHKTFPNQKHAKRRNKQSKKKEGILAMRIREISLSQNAVFSFGEKQETLRNGKNILFANCIIYAGSGLIYKMSEVLRQ